MEITKGLKRIKLIFALLLFALRNFATDLHLGDRGELSPFFNTITIDKTTTMSTHLSKNFTLEELTKSSTAKRLKIDNTPTKEIKENLSRLATEVLQPIRDAWKDSVVVTSGYRSQRLNNAVGGSKTSDHLYGCAADIHTVSDKVEDNKRLFDLVCKMAKEGKIECRQILDEYNFNWIHVSINNTKNKQKTNEILHIK